MLIASVNSSLNELIDLVDQLTLDDYTFSCPELSGSSIGEHTRHIIEMFQCLQNQYTSGVVNYDLRARNHQIQTDRAFAIAQIVQVQANLDRANKPLLLQQKIDEDLVAVESNYTRELLYNLEHCIHHQALIKVGLLNCHAITIDDNFGVARSTIEYRKQCAR
jgi:hypothetical protein